MPWRRTSVDKVGEAELRELYIEGFWSDKMGPAASYDMAEVREARGVGLSKREVAVLEEECKGLAWCIDTRIALGELP